ncbi:YdcH family protein [Pseudooceanicola sp. HF7]|uniref:YdcH family protein n=1 Tax=Pseudooceanicola sp. HF7 TaxID=2721560 RepID=UPI0014319441|nr:YdcH family protein [Pseudooceanicola sp. HF7]NIZ10234.1 YdcH family protein [Pseudooceanicola sp. HF7]
MSNTPHQLHDEFPEYADALHALKVSDAHFARLAEDYQNVNGQIHRAETNIAPVEDLAMIELRKQRGALKDQIFAALKAAQPTS